MRRFGVLVLLLAWTAGCGGSQPTAPPPPPLDLGAAHRVFASTDRDAILALVARVTRESPPPVRWLVDNLDSADRGVREWSAHALGDLAPQDAGIVAALMRSFEDPDDWVRWKAARALGRIGPPLALPALSMLRAAAEAQQETEIVRASAQEAVARLRGEAGASD